MKGSGGDLGTLTEQNLAVLRLDRLRALVDVYPGVDREDEMVAAFDYCLHGKGGAAPSIDTAMHGLVDAAARGPPAPRLRDRAGHRRGRGEADRASASATGWCGCRGGARASSSAWTSPRSRPRTRRPSACILGGHGITAWGDTSEEAEANSLEIIRTARAVPRRATASPSRSARSCPGYEPLPEAERRAKAAAIFPTIRGLASTDRPQVGHYTDSDVVLEFLAREKLAALAELGTSCPDHFLRTKVKPLVVDLPGDRVGGGDPRPAAGAARRPTATDYQGYYDRNATPDSPGDARRRPGDRAGARAWGCSPSARTSRPPGSPASSTSTRST